MSKKIFRSLPLAFLSLLIVCQVEAPGIRNISAPALFPEGVAFYPEDGSFLLSSMTKGTVSKLRKDGSIQTLIQDPKLKSTLGVYYDDTRKRILVCNSDPGVSDQTSKGTQARLAGLGIYDARSGKRIRYLDLGAGISGKHFANDLTMDALGNIYVTDSFSPIIYKIAKDYHISIFLRNKAFSGKGFNLNGIVYHPEGYLLVAKYNSGKLYKIPLLNPEAFHVVKLASDLRWADGLVLIDKKSLAVVRNGNAHELLILTSTDAWKSASLSSRYAHPRMDFPTTATLTPQGLYVLNAKLNALFQGKRDIKKFQLFPKNALKMIQ